MLHHNPRRRRTVVGALSVCLWLGANLTAIHGAVHAQEPALHQAQQQVLTPEAAIRRAFANNPEVQVARFNVEQARGARDVAEGARAAVFYAGTNVGYTERLTGTGAGIANNNTRTINGNAGLRYTTRWGTSLTVDVNTNRMVQEINRDNATSSTVFVGPNYAANTTMTVRQPLLRGAGEEAQLADISSAAASLTEAERTREATASQLMRDVIAAYWELWYAERAVTLQREALAVAEQQLADVTVRVESLGTAARTDVFRFATEHASIQEGLASAEATRRTASFELGRMLGLTPEQASELRLSDTGPVVTPPGSLPLEIEASSARSPELAALQQQIQAAQLRVQIARNAGLSRLDVVTTLGAGGLWTEDMLPGLQLPGGRPAVVGTIGLELELPLGRNQADGSLASALAEKSRAEAQYEARQAQLRAEVAAAHEALASALLRAEFTEAGVEHARGAADGEQHRLSLGTATATDVILAQQTYRQAELRRLRTIVDAAVSNARLRQATGQLLIDHRELASPMGVR